MKPLLKPFQVAGVQGFEPQLTDPESAVLPLNDTPSCLRTVFLIFPFAWKILHDVAQVVKGESGRIYKGWRNSIYVSIPHTNAASRLALLRCADRKSLFIPHTNAASRLALLRCADRKYVLARE